MSVHWPSQLYVEPLNFDLNAYPDTASIDNADPDLNGPQGVPESRKPPWGVAENCSGRADEGGMKGAPTHNLLVIHTHNSLRVTWRSRKSHGGVGEGSGG